MNVTMAGRPPATSQAELERIAFSLFEQQGFDQTTVDDIARAAGIGRRTFFRYFQSKNDIPWGAFERELEQMRAHLAATPRDMALMDALRVAIVDFNRLDPAAVAQHRRRMELILRVPTLLAHSTLRFAAWRQVVAEFAAARSGRKPGDLAPQAIAQAMLGVSIAAYELWLDTPESDLSALLDAAMQDLQAAYR